MAQQIINTGAVANDGTGDPLRTAFTETNSNFTEIYTAGPVGSNVRIANNTVLTINTNGNLVLAPNGTGVVQSNVNIVPNQANVRNLGSSTARWGTVYAKYVDITNGTIYSGDLTVSGNLFANAVIAPELTVNTIRSDDSTVVKIQDGVEVDGDILANGNVTADYVLGDGSQLMNISVGNAGAVQFNWQGSLSNQGGTPGDTYSTLQFDSNGMPTLDGTTAYQQRVDYSPYLQVLAPRVESTDFGIVAGPAIQITGYADDVFYNTPRSAYLSVQDQTTATQQWDFGILGNGSNAFSIQNRTASTIPLVISTDGTVTASTIITNDISSDDSSFVTIQDGLNVVGDIETRGNVTADYFIGDGSQLTGLPEQYGNSNVATFLAVYGSNTIVTTGNISAGNVLTSAEVIASGVIQSGTGLFTGGYLSVNGTTDLHDTTVTGNLSVSVIRNNDSTIVLIEDGVEIDGDAVVNGNVTADYFIGDGSQLTGLPANYNNSNVTTLLSNLGSNVISGTGNITTTANISGVYIKGNGSELTNLPAPTVAQDIASTGDMSIMTYDGNLKYVNYATVEPASGNIKSAGVISATGNVIGGNIRTAGVISATGNIIAGNLDAVNLVINSISSDDSTVVSVQDGLQVYGNITADNIGTVAAVNLDGNVSNVLSGTGTWIAAGGGAANTGNVTFDDQAVVGTGDQVGGSGLYLAPGTESVGNLQYIRVRGGDVATHIHLDTGNNAYFDQYFGSDIKYVKLEAAGNVQIGSNDDTGNSASWTFGVDGNLTVPGDLVIAGNTNVFGTNASLIQTTDDLPLLSLSSGGNGSVSSLWVEDIGNIGTSNIAAVYVNPVPGSGNVRIAVGANGNAGPNLWDFDASGNLSIPGNINFSGDSSAAPSLNDFFSVTSAANFSIITDSANTDQTWNFGTDGNLTAPGNISAVGNITGAYILGNGSQLTGIASSYGNANVVANLAALGSNPISTTGNITAGNISTGKITLTNGAVIRDTAGDAVAFGQDAGLTNQGLYAVAIGETAGNTSQGLYGVAVGQEAGSNIQGYGAVAVGSSAGYDTQGTQAVAIGIYAGYITQGANSVAVGQNAGHASQGINAVAIGYLAGNSSQGVYTVAIGNSAGQTSQGSESIAIGSTAGQTTQGAFSVAVGLNAGRTSQGGLAVALGYNAGLTSQGQEAVAIGYGAGQTSQATRSIIINATGSALNQTTADTFTVAPVRNDVSTANVGQVMFYNTTSKEITYGNVISVAGNVTAGNLITSGLTVNGAGVVTGNLQIQGNLTYNNLTNITTANLVFGLANTTTGISANGAGFVVGNTAEASFLYNYTAQSWDSNIGISAVGNVAGGNLRTAGLISATGNVTAGNVSATNITGTLATAAQTNITSVGTLSGLSVTANVTGGNILTAGIVSSTGNVTGNYIIGNGSQLTGVTAYTNANVSTFLAAFGSNTISTTGSITSGNVTGGNVLTGGIVSATGNITGGNIRTVGLISSTGNITSGNISATNHTGTTVSVAGNITGGNVLTGGVVSATGNITGGNISATNHTGTTVSVTANVTGGNILTAGQVSATGNITTANSFVGNLTGTTVSVTGNISAGNVIVNGQPTTYGVVNPQYISVTNNTPQNIANVSAGGTTLTWDTTLSSNGITYSAGGFALTAGLTYQIQAEISLTNYTGYMIVQLVDTSNNSQIGSPQQATIVSSNAGFTEANNGTLDFIYTPSANQTVAFRVVSGSANITGQHRGTGFTRASIVQINPTIAVQATATGTVATNYIATTRTSSNQTITTGGTDIVLNTTDKSSGSSVTYNTSTGVYTLTAGTTYELSFTPSWNYPSGGSSYIQYDWVDATTNTSLDSDSGSFCTAYAYTYTFASHNHNIISKLVYTPATNQTVKIRATATNNTGAVLATGSSAYVKAMNAIFALNTLETMTITGNVTTSGNVSATGNVTAANFFGNGATLSNVATTFESTWTVPTGNSTQSFTVTASNTYLMWVDCNIANGILAWNATGTVTNTNVPVVGAQYAWVYTGGGTPIDFTSIPNQFVGTANTILRSSVSPSATTNRFDFGINNTSGGNVTVRYGWAQIS